jgi:S-adenosylmethionine:tRNA ribosyltransferase-isomerase
MTVHPTQHTLRTDELDYRLPERLIATKPAEPRDSARMLVVHLGRDAIEHRTVRDLPEYLRQGDQLVFNTSAVAPARLVGARADSGGRMEGIFLDEFAPAKWRVMLRSNSRLRAGQRMMLFDHADEASGEELELIERDDECWIVRLVSGNQTMRVLERIGRTPLPPYILRARGEHSVADELDRRWYQTVYADPMQRQSVAAPTAGLHFTPELLQTIDVTGVERLLIALHVGTGTFKPVTAETLDQHAMHTERFEVSPAVMQRLIARQSAIGDRQSLSSRLIAVGTTTVRTLESLPVPLPELGDQPYRAETDLLIVPPYHFRLVDGMLTNFHLPRSTLLALVAAMVGLERLKAIYAEAIRGEYRFYSYGDAMLILP